MDEIYKKLLRANTIESNWKKKKVLRRELNQKTNKTNE
jgi:hypothetical protein